MDKFTDGFDLISFGVNLPHFQHSKNKLLSVDLGFELPVAPLSAPYGTLDSQADPCYLNIKTDPLSPKILDSSPKYS